MGCGASSKPKTVNPQPARERLSVEPETDHDEQIREEQYQRSPTHSSHRTSSRKSNGSAANRKFSSNGAEPSENSVSPMMIVDAPTTQNDSDVLADEAPITSDQLVESNVDKNAQSSPPSASPIKRDDNGSARTPRTARVSTAAKSVKSGTRPISSASADSFIIHRNSTTPNGGSQTGKSSRSDVRKISKVSALSHDHIGRCPYCHHCRRLKSGRIPSAAKLKWIVENPGVKGFTINMDEYDVDAVTEQIVEEHGRIPGSYDYQPYLTIEEEEADENVDIKNNYYKLPFVARKGPPVTPTHTPFPNYKDLQTREQRPNKPYELPLFD